MTESGRSVLGLMEGLDPLAAKFALPADLLSLYSVSSTAAPLPVDMPGLEVLDEPAGVVVSVDLDVRREVSLALMLTRAAFDQAVCNLRQLGGILQSRREENPQAWLSSLPVASSLFALLFNEVYRREPPILGVKEVVGPSPNFLFQVSVVSLKEALSNSELVMNFDEHLQVATHYIIVRQNDFGIVKPEWLGRVVAPA